MKRVRWVTLLAPATASMVFGQPLGRGPWRLPGVRSEAGPTALPWGLRAAAHSMRRAGFSASPSKLQRIVEQGFDQTLRELLHPGRVDDSEDLDFGPPGGDVVPVFGVARENQLFLGADFVDYYLAAMLQGDVSLDTRHVLEDYLDAGDFGTVHPFAATEPGAIDKKVRGLIQLISFLPVYQLN